MHQVEYSRSALRALRRIPTNVSLTLRRKIDQLAVDPFAQNNNATKLQGRDGYRLRVGDWRIINDVYRNRLVIQVIDIKPRGGAYQ